MRSLIYGYGDTGKSFERYLDSKKFDYEIFDINISHYNLNYDFQDFDQILCSPGIPKNILKFCSFSSSGLIIFTTFYLFVLK